MKKLLVIGYLFPEPATNAAGVRMMQLLDFFTRNNYHVTFSTTAEKTPFSEDLPQKGINVKNIRLNESSFDSFVKELNPDIVLFDRFFTEEQFGWRVAESCPDALRILDTEDLHFLRKAREKQVTSPNRELDLFSDTAQREIAAIFRSDLSLIISKNELQLLQNEFNVPSEILHYLPFLPEKTTRETPGFEERNDLVFAGNFNHSPNVDAVVCLNEIWKILAEHLPDATVQIYGAHPPDAVLKLHQPQNRFVINGWVENIDNIYRKARVMLAPIRFGAGQKGKLIGAMQNGLPSITTSIGAEGIADEAAWSGFVTNDVARMIQQTIILYQDKTAWEIAQKKGLSILEINFNTPQFEKSFNEKIIFLTSNHSSHRKNNFIGAMLRHQHLYSSKYLSKWIEAKNKFKESP